MQGCCQCKRIYLRGMRKTTEDKYKEKCQKRGETFFRLPDKQSGGRCGRVVDFRENAETDQRADAGVR